MYKRWMTTALICFLLFIYVNPTNAQFAESASEKIWPTKQIDVLLANFRDDTGTPSRNVFLKKHGAFPLNSTQTAVPYFELTFASNDVHIRDKNLKLSRHANPLNLDFYTLYENQYIAFNKLLPIWDGRAYEQDNKIIIGGYSSRHNERPVAKITDSGEFIPTADQSVASDFPLLAIPADKIVFDPFTWSIFKIESVGGKVVAETTKDYVPLSLIAKNGKVINDEKFSFEINESIVSLYVQTAGEKIKLAMCDLESQIVEKRAGYQPKLQQGCVQPENGDVVTVTLQGTFSKNVSAVDNMLLLDRIINEDSEDKRKNQDIVIDGNFDEWRNIDGISDPEGDYVSYLFPNPDTDILEFKMSNDDQYLYFYSRVAGAHGQTGETGRYYWYTYIDVDANPNTGYPPTRDDNCYFGIAIGDDCEAQFEFVGNKFIKTFFGFTGVGAEQQALDGKLTLGPSYYSAKDSQGNKRDRYKIEYVNREGTRKITHDNTEGSSEDIIMALSADGSEVEMRVEMKGFLIDVNGKQLVSKGSIINIAVGAEGDSGHLGSDKWGADSSPVLYGYEIK